MTTLLGTFRSIVTVTLTWAGVKPGATGCTPPSGLPETTMFFTAVRYPADGVEVAES